MRKLLLFLLIPFSVFSQTTNFSFTKIPTTASPDLVKTGAGLEYWIYQSVVPYPLTTSPTGEANILGNRYDRFEWRDFENGTQGTYNWTSFDNSINAAISKKQKFSFGIMTYCESCTDFSTSVGGGTLTSYPLYLHTLMQAEATNSKDWIASNGTWIPNYNSTNYLNRHKALLDALAAHIAATSFNGVPYSRAIRYIDVRGIGNYNEWHHYGYLDEIPTGRFPTVATYKRVVDDYIAAFPNFQLVALSDGYDTQGSSNTPAEVVSYLLTASNNRGKLGYRRDNIGSGYLWVGSKLENNPAVYGGVNLKDSIMTRWKTAPLVGEMMNCCSADGGSGEYFDLSRQVTYYNINSFGNGNYESSGSANTNSKVTAAAKLMGFRYLTESGSMATTITRGVPFNITLGWKNEGNSPTYDRWYIDFTLRNTTTNAIVWTGTSTYNLRGLLPLGSATSVSENFTVPTTVANGTYRLHMTVRDSAGYMNNMPLFINGVQSDGSYILRATVTVTSTGNVSPVASAGADQAITSPTSSVTLSGSGTDSDGTISSYAWTKISGTGGTIVSASSASTSVTGLSVGTYVFRLTVTDNGGATGTDDIQITVNASAPANVSPVANAGVDQTITLPTSSFTLSGSGTDADGTIVSYAWTRTYGTAGTITSPSSASTTVTGITYSTILSFRLTVTDNNGATAYDDVDIYVNPAPNVLPVANAGSDQTITLPTNQVSLTGSGTDADGSVTTYLWTKVSGPAGQVISPTNTASTLITSLIQGTYVFRLRVTDNDGGQHFDDVTVTVNPAVVPPTSGNWIFTTNPSPLGGNDGTGLTLGVKFRATQAGAILRIRYWKTSYSTGTHVGGLYSASGTLLASGTFTGETTSGWQYVTLNDTVFISANTTYVASVFMPNGQYGYTENYFANTQTNNYMQAQASDLVGGNGVYTLGGSLTFPSSTFLKTNYWIDAEWLNLQPPAPANVGPTVSAGLDTVLIAPNSSYQVVATASDVDGTIASYAWTQLDGPSCTISNPAIANPTISAMTTGGDYIFLVTVTDDDGATSTDMITISVHTAATQWRVRQTFIYKGRMIYFRR